MPDDLITIKIDGNMLLKALNRLENGLKSPMLMEAVGLNVAKWSRERIEGGANRAPDGSIWEALKPSTIKQKQKKGLAHRGMLQRYLDLSRSIVAQDATPESVTVGASPIYALIHQLGGKAGRGRNVTIPARPYLGISDNEKRLLKEKVALYLKKLLEDGDLSDVIRELKQGRP
jgi:phage virion morphogenesis protein